MSTKDKPDAKPGVQQNTAGKADAGKQEMSQTAMSNAERKYMKSEKYKKQQRDKFAKKVILISILAILVIAAASVAVYASMQSAYGHIMKFDGKKIPTEEFKLLYTLYGSKEDALEVLQENLLIEKAAANQGVVLSDEELAAAKSEVKGFKEYIEMLGTKAPKISDDRYAEILGIGTLYNKMSAIIDSDLEIDEDEFQVAFEEYLETGRQYYIDTQMKYVISGSELDSSFAREMLITSLEADPEFDVDSIIKEYSAGYSEENGVELLALSTLGLDTETVNAILDLEVGGISESINFGEGVYVFFIIDSITIPEDEVIKENYLAQYRSEQVYTIFEGQFEEWKGQTEIVVNQKAYDRIK